MDLLIFAGILIGEILALCAIFKRTQGLPLKVSGFFAVTFAAATARNLFQGPGINKQTATMAFIHAVTATIVLTLIFLVWSGRGRDQ